MYPLIPVESLTSVIQIGLMVISLFVAMLGFVMSR
jgi:hypothetical protein